MVEYLKAFKRPFKDKWIFLRALIPIYNFAVFGYILECIRNTWKGKEELTDWKASSWLDKIIILIKTFIMPFIYFILPFLILGIIIFIKREEINKIIPYSAYILIGLLYFFASYYSLAGIISYVKKWDLKDISYKRINKIIFTGKYFVAWFIAFILLSLISLLSLFGEIPYLSWFNIVIYWILQLPAWTIIAEAIREIEIEKGVY